MKPLFVRILCLLLGAFATVAILSFLVFKWVSEELHPGEGKLRALVEETAEQVVSSYQDGSLDEFRRRLHHRYRTRVWLLDSQNNALTRPPMPTDISTQIDRYPTAIYPYQNNAGRFFIFGQPVESKGTRYHVVLASKGPPPGSGFFRGSLTIPLLLIVTLITASAILSYWILRPLRVLNRVTKSLTADRLDIKVPPQLTKRKDAFGELGVEFNRMTDRVQNTIHSQHQLLRDVSHELRSPLARIQVAASLWQQKHGASTEVDRIEEEVERLNQLIEKLLTLSRLQNLNSTVTERIELQQLLQCVIDDCNFEYSTDDRFAKLVSDNEHWIVGNSELLVSCFENIIRNALRHSPHQGVVSIEIHQSDSMTIIEVHDQGSGVPVEDLERIFDPFYRGDTAREINAGHHGIGLAIAQAVVQLHRGKILASINSDGGLTVRCCFPIS